MREIKYRGKRVDNGEWVYGYYSKSTPIFEGVGHSYITPICENGSIDMYRKVNPNTVGEYAGLKDKNGKEIYEGDILHNEEEDSISTINWYDLVAQFVACTSPYEEDRHLELYLSDGCVVVGNIYENPELLEAK